MLSSNQGLQKQNVCQFAKFVARILKVFLIYFKAIALYHKRTVKINNTKNVLAISLSNLNCMVIKLIIKACCFYLKIF